MTVDDLEDNMVSMYWLIHSGEQSDKEDEYIREHDLVAHKIGNVKGKFQGECYHCGKKGHREIYCFLK